MTTNSQIKGIYQLCIRRLSELNYNFVFIYEMADGGYTCQEYQLTLEKARMYFEKRSWPLTLPEEIGKTIMVVRYGNFIGHYKIKNTNLPPK